MRIVDIKRENVASRETANMEKFLGVRMDSQLARAMQGSLAITFSELEEEGVRIFDEPGVVDFLTALHVRIPHLLYFLFPDPQMGSMEGLLMTLVDGNQVEVVDGRDAMPITDEVVQKLTDHLEAAAHFATRVGDDWRPIIKELLEVAGELSTEIMADLETRLGRRGQ